MTEDNADKGIEVYFVVSYNPKDGSFGIDDDRADAVFSGEDVWNAEINEWEKMYDHAEIVENAREALTNLVATTWKKD
jgi:hypothetical protein